MKNGYLIKLSSGEVVAITTQSIRQLDSSTLLLHNDDQIAFESETILTVEKEKN